MARPRQRIAERAAEQSNTQAATQPDSGLPQLSKTDATNTANVASSPSSEVPANPGSGKPNRETIQARSCQGPILVPTPKYSFRDPKSLNQSRDLPGSFALC